MRMGIGIGIPMPHALIKGGGVPAWSPLAYYAAGERGPWYSIRDIGTLWKDTAGTIPVTTAGDLVARIDDKSGNGLHATQSTPSKRASYQIDSNGNPYLLPDGLDDTYVIGPIDLTVTSQLTLMAGIRKLSDAAAGSVAEFNTNWLNGSGTFALFAPVGASATITTAARGSASATGGHLATASSQTAPLSRVVTGLFGIAADQNVLRLDGIQSATSSQDQGTGAFGNYTLYLFSRGGTSQFFSGRAYEFVLRGAASTPEEIALGETFVGAGMGIAL